MDEREAPQYVIVSPHADDAALACGGLLCTRGHQIRVVTVCAGIPPVDVPASHWDRRCGFTHAHQAALVRREEDRRACTSAGAQLVHLDWYDGAYTDVLGTGKTLRGAATLDDLTEALLPLLDGAQVWLPAGLGAHPDHLMVRDAGLRALRRLGTAACVYADAPYAGEETPAVLDVAAASYAVCGPHRRRLSPSETAYKIALARHYASQLGSLGGLYPRLTDIDGELATEVWWVLRPAG